MSPSRNSTEKKIPNPNPKTQCDGGELYDLVASKAFTQRMVARVMRAINAMKATTG